MTRCEVICLAPSEWTGAWQRYQEIMHRFAQADNSVLVIENLYRMSPSLPPTRAAALQMIGKGWDLMRSLRFRGYEVEPRLTILSLPVFPLGRFIEPAWLLLRMSMRRYLRLMESRSVILWCAWPTPMVERVIEEVRPGIVVYDCTSALNAEDRVDPAVIAAEASLLRVADLVFTPSRNLWERLSRGHPRCFWIPHGVDFARFAQPGKPARRLWSSPVIGYIGTVHVWLDVQLIHAIASEHPEWRFIFVGPRRVRAETDLLEQLPNVEFLGPRPHEALPDLLMQFDVAWIPYRLVEFTRYVVPMKMMEYLAAGRPVISTDLPEVRPFAPPVRIGKSSREIGEYIAAALQDPSNNRGQEIARTFDWQIQMNKIHHHLDEVLATSPGRR